jgi:hypothetical protein
MCKFLKFLKELLIPTVDQLAIMVRDDRYPDTSKLADDINTLISWAENLWHLRVAVKSGHPASGYHISGKVNYRQLWGKWLKFATNISELQEMKEYWKWLDADEKTSLVRKWYALATTLDEMLGIPRLGRDKILQELVTTKRRELFLLALQNASTCNEITSICLKVDSEDEPSGSLTQFDAWQKDEDADLPQLMMLCDKYDTSFKTDASDKWHIVSKRKIAAAQSLAELRLTPTSEIHERLTAEYIERWDALAMAEVTVTSTVEDLERLRSECRKESAARRLVYEKLDDLMCGLLQKEIDGASPDSLSRNLCFTNEYPKAHRIAVEKHVDLATTEDVIRSIWSCTDKFPDLRERLANKLTLLIK